MLLGQYVASSYHHNNVVYTLLTVSNQSIKFRVSSNNVGLSFKWWPKRMFPSSKNIVAETTSRKDVNSYRLKPKHSQLLLCKYFRSIQADMYYQIDQQKVSYNILSTVLTTRDWLVSISGAIHPSVPVTPDLMENEPCPLASWRQRPKSEMIARTSPRKFGLDRSTFCGLMSRCTVCVMNWTRKMISIVHTNA